MRRSSVAGLVVAAAVLVAGAMQSGAVPPPPPVTGEGSCDVDGVDVSYTVSFESTPAPGRHRVTAARVGDTSDTCKDAEVRVQLLNGTTVLASGAVTSDGEDEVVVPFDPPPLAHSVTGVHVELDGGTVPLPEECQGIKIGNVRIGTSGSDQLTGTGANDLIYALDGDDVVKGGIQRDCLVGGNGADTLEGENHNDVLVGGAGADQLDGGLHDDKLYGGEGDDVLRGGQHDDHLDGGPGFDRCFGDHGKDTFVNCEEWTQ
jgi:hypothetical protein